MTILATLASHDPAPMSTLPGILSIVAWTGGASAATEYIGGDIVTSGFHQFYDKTIAPQRSVSPGSDIWYSQAFGEPNGKVDVQVTAMQQMRNAGLGSAVDDILAGLKRSRPIVTYIGGNDKADLLLLAAKDDRHRRRLIHDALDPLFDLGAVAFDAGSAWTANDLMLEIVAGYVKRGHRAIIEAFPTTEKTWLTDGRFGYCVLESTWNNPARETWGYAPVNRDSTLLCADVPPGCPGDETITAARAAAYRAQGLNVAGVWEPGELRLAVFPDGGL